MQSDSTNSPMSAAALSPELPRDKDSWNPYLIIVPALLLSVGIHLGTVSGLSRSRPMVVQQKPIEIEMVTIEPPKPPPEPEKPPEPPKVKPPEVKVATVKPPPEAPPPPNEEAPQEPPKPVPIMVGISMSSTTSAGSFAAPTGNTAYGAVPKQGSDETPQAYRAPKYVPPGGADTEPIIDQDYKPPYPEEAKRNGIEGTVLLRVRVEADGRVSEVEVLRGLGYGLDEAAREGIKRIKFKPAIKGGEPVATKITYNFTFMLD